MSKCHPTKFVESIDLIELEMMVFVISVPIPIPFLIPISMPRFQYRGLQMARYLDQQSEMFLLHASAEVCQNILKLRCRLIVLILYEALK